MAGLQKPYLIPAMHCKETAWAFVLIWIYVRGSLKESHITFRQLLKGQAILLKLQHLLKYFWMFCLKKFSDSSPHCSIRWELCLRKRIGAKMCVTYFLPHLLLLTGISEYGAYCLLVCCPYWCLIKGVRSCIISIIINFGPCFLPNGGRKKKKRKTLKLDCFYQPQKNPAGGTESFQKQKNICFSYIWRNEQWWKRKCHKGNRRRFNWALKNKRAVFKFA